MQRRMAAALTLAVVIAVGCAGVATFVREHQALSKFGLQKATTVFLEKHPALTPGFVAVADATEQAALAGELVTVELAAVFVRQRIDYGALDPLVAMDLDNLIDVLKEETSRLIAGKGLAAGPETQAVLAQAVGWIAQAGRVMLGRG